MIGASPATSIMKSIVALVLAASCAALFTGCVTGRREVDLPIAAIPAAASTKDAIHIASITDDRVFENKPRNPSTPSIDGDVTSLTPAMKDVMIGRQRNGFGKAMGDIALSGGETVTKRVRALVERGMQQRGHRVTDDVPSATAASVSIVEFWAWGTPGMWSISFEARVTCRLTITNAGKSNTLLVQGYGLNHGQVAKDANWQLAYERAFNDFNTKLISELDKSGY
jgi:hypothetical protein